MRKWIIAAVGLVAVGIATTVWQLREKGQEVADSTSAPTQPADPFQGLPPPPEPEPKPPKGTPVVPPPPTSDPQDELPPGELPIRFASANGPDASPEVRLRREGTRLNEVVGTIRRQGDEYVFSPADNSPPLVLLKNLLLQRVDRASDASGNAAPPKWKVTGLVTEYRGSNFLLLERIFMDRP